MNNTTNIFETASKRKFRYPYKGMITTEDLWDLTPAQLDTVYKTLNKDINQNQEESLLGGLTGVDVELVTKINIVKHIFQVKQTEVEDRKIAAANAEKKQRLLEILAKKQNESLENMSEDELLKAIADLG